jgi:hypothetical protein
MNGIEQGCFLLWKEHPNVNPSFGFGTLHVSQRILSLIAKTENSSVVTPMGCSQCCVAA